MMPQTMMPQTMQPQPSRYRLTSRYDVPRYDDCFYTLREIRARRNRSGDACRIEKWDGADAANPNYQAVPNNWEPA